MSPDLVNPRRLSEGPPSGDPTEAQAARLMGVLRAEAPRLSPSARARIAARLEPRAPAGPRIFRRRVWPLAVVGALILFAGGAVGAAVGVRGFEPVRRFVIEWLGSTPATAPVTAPATAPARPARAAPAEAVAVVSAAARTEPTAGEPVHRAAGGHVARVMRTIAKPNAEDPDPIVAESRLLGEALGALGQERDPQRALRVLDQYDRRFPAGSLAPEAAAARIDASLALGQKDRALARLETVPLARLPRAAEMQVLRGELRAARGNPAGAAEDFEAVLAAPATPANLVERALYGRSSCRSRLGDHAGARADLEQYLRRFPHGRFAASAGRALGD